jgi:hypothetical protein
MQLLGSNMVIANQYVKQHPITENHNGDGYETKIITSMPKWIDGIVDYHRI